jgi:hypothetical protein
MRWRTFVLSQVPGLILLTGICWISILEAGALEIATDGAALLMGICAALFFWAVVSTIYYYSYKSLQASEKGASAHTDAGALAPIAFVLPGGAQLSRGFGSEQTAPPPFTQGLKTVFQLTAAVNGRGYQDLSRPPQLVKNHLAAWFLRRCGMGSASQPVKAAPLLPGHALNIVLGFWSLLAYIAICPFTAPVPLPTGVLAVSILFAMLALLWVGNFGIQYAHAQREERRLYTGRTLLIGCAVPLVLLLYVPAGYALLHNLPPFRHVWYRPIPALPAIVPVLMLLIIICWILAGLSFFLDRFRVPVLASVIVTLAILHVTVHLLGGIGQHQGASAVSHSASSAVSWVLPSPKDHFIDFGCMQQVCNTPATEKDAVTPADVLAMRWHPGQGHPLIVVTATGGGIHAAAWTAEILAALEHAFAAKGQSFHDSILLLSTVSGGSYGSVPFVRGYFHPNTFKDMAETGWLSPSQPKKPGLYEQLFGPSYKERVQSAAPEFISAVTTSSLEAVSWGIVYPDMFRLLWPSRSILGLVDLEEYDRGWAMQRRMDVNMKVEDCPVTPSAMKAASKAPSKPWSSITTSAWQWQCLTLRGLAWGVREGKVPAVSFNTTTAENGGRFLLANYQAIDPLAKLSYPAMPALAESFLHDYGASPYVLAGQKENFYPDLELLSAARMSATFPYVSPMPRVSRVRQPGSDDEVFADSLHFGDGGYFDNDGTATAIEFLYQAFTGYKGTEKAIILWIEIRDDDSFHEERNPDQCTSQIVSGSCPNEPGVVVDAVPQAPISQSSAPLAAFWEAGHVSVSLRDHREMAIVERAFTNEFTIYHQSFPFHKSSPKESEPLSWHLTGRQKDELATEIRTSGTASCVAEWFAACAEQKSCAEPHCPAK